jgi:serine protease Do/serine protease DegQ
MKKPWLWVSLLMFGFIQTPLQAALPVAVDGEPLPTLAPMIERAAPAVVNIASTKVEKGALVRDPFWGTVFRQPPRRAQSLGSGVIVDAGKGYILTNHHVIADADAITVRLHDGREFQARLVGSDRSSDVAVVQIKASGLSALPLADSDKLRVGDFVVAIGNPFNLGQSVTSGIVSAVGRQGLGIEDFEDFIQTDAAINPGNSGGALVNLRGELVGINTAIIGPAGGNVGIGFAIPINLAHRLMQQLIRYGEVRRGQLGIRGDTLTPELAHALGVDLPQGIVVTEVIPGSAADEAGIQTYDVITRVDDKPVQNLAQVNNYVGLLPAGTRVRLQVVRNGEPVVRTAVIKEPDYQKTDGGDVTPMLAGTVLEQHFDASGAKDGIRVRKVSPDSRASYWGLREDDRIVSVGRFDVRTMERFRELLKNYEGPLTLKIVRDDRWLILTMR